MIRSNPRNLIIEKWQDDRIFAEQQIAGINPYAVKRVTSKRKCCISNIIILKRASLGDAIHCPIIFLYTNIRNDID